MDREEKIETLKKEVRSCSNPYRLIDELIDLEGFAAMKFFQSLFLSDGDSAGKSLATAAGYGVKKLLSVRAQESVNDFKFCPVCKSALHKYEIADLYSVGLKCSKDHRFHVEIRQNELYEKTLTVKADKTVDVAKEWLTNEEYRKNIHSQIAEILRKYVEINSPIERPENQNTSLNYCPVCGLSLTEFEQGDVWMKGLECTNKHTFYARNGLRYNNATIKPDISETDLYSLVDWYLNSERKDHLPNQIVALFNTMLTERQ